MLKVPVVLRTSACTPFAVLSVPVVLLWSVSPLASAQRVFRWQLGRPVVTAVRTKEARSANPGCIYHQKLPYKMNTIIKFGLAALAAGTFATSPSKADNDTPHTFTRHHLPIPGAYFKNKENQQPASVAASKSGRVVGQRVTVGGFSCQGFP